MFAALCRIPLDRDQVGAARRQAAEFDSIRNRVAFRPVGIACVGIAVLPGDAGTRHRCDGGPVCALIDVGGWIPAGRRNLRRRECTGQNRGPCAERQRCE